MKNPLQIIDDWFAQQCDGNWEHNFGIKLQTLDNPGWNLDVDLEITQFEDVPEYFLASLTMKKKIG